MNSPRSVVRSMLLAGLIALGLTVAGVSGAADAAPLRATDNPPADACPALPQRPIRPAGGAHSVRDPCILPVLWPMDPPSS